MFLLYTRLSDLHLKRTRIGVSSVAGRGIFASCDCKKGDLLTCYPGDALVVIPDEGGWTVLWGSHVDESSSEYGIDELLGYIVHVNDDIGVIGLESLDQEVLSCQWQK